LPAGMGLYFINRLDGYLVSKSDGEVKMVGQVPSVEEIKKIIG